MANIQSSNFPELLWPGIKERWGSKYKMYPALYVQFYTKKKSTLRFEKEQGVTSLPLAGIKTEGGQLPFVGSMQGFQKEYVNLTYAVGTTVTEEMMEDDQYGYIRELPALLAQSLYQTEETVAHDVLNNGFAAQGNEADGQAIISANHPLVGGGTLSNTPGTAADLTQTSLENAFIDISKYVDDQSHKIRVMPTRLVIPSDLQFVAEKILKTGKEVGSADNTVNPMYGQLPMTHSPYFTDADAWFLTTDAQNGLTFYTKREADIDRDNDFDTKNLKFSTSKRFAVGVTNFRGVYGSPGA